MEKTVTALEVQKRNPDRINVYLDGDFAFGISRIVGAWLSVGKKIDQVEIETLIREDERERALQNALHFIGYQQRTESEIINKLENLEFSQEIINQVLSELKEKRYIDDQEFAVQWIDSRKASKPRSKRFIEIELKKKGIDEEIINIALENAPDDLDSAMLLGKKYLKRYSTIDDKEFQKKIHGVLARRAYSYSSIKETVETLIRIRNENK